MEIPRPAPPRSAPEREMLEAWLDFHRTTLERKCHGLSPAQLRKRAVPPSALSLLGLVRHMADVERNWFRRALAVAYPRAADNVSRSLPIRLKGVNQPIIRT